MPPHFTPEALRFLADLEQHNDRPWFEANKPLYERALKDPFLDLIAAINEKLEPVAPEHLRPPQKIMMRLYRDTRFSANKLPYKTHLAAWWARHDLAKTSGAGFYLQLSAAELTIAAGAYMPQPDQLLAIRRHLLDHHEAYRALLADKRLKRVLTPFDGLRLTRAPKGFPAGHPAADLILQRQWGVSTILPADHALASTLVQEIVSRFRIAAPLVALLNTPLTPATPRPLF